MKRTLHIVAMAVLSLMFRAHSAPAPAEMTDMGNMCYAQGSICSVGQDCCSQKCDCNGTDCRCLS